VTYPAHTAGGEEARVVWGRWAGCQTRGMRIRAGPDDRAALEGFLSRWNTLHVARRGVVENALDHPAWVAEAEEERRLLGVLTYVLEGSDCEVLTLHVDDRRRGVGSALIGRVKEIAARAGCTRLWLITNDNLDALRFYQPHGFVWRRSTGAPWTRAEHA
jgi:ribosomal protein S18 acetylase RimI-like enzyme